GSMNPRIVLAGAVLVVALAAFGSYLYFSQRPTINVLEIQGDSQVNQWQCAKYAVAAPPSLSNRLSAVDLSTFGISTKFYTDPQCQLEVTSIPLDKTGVLTSPGGQSVHYGSFYFYSSAPPHTENVVATGKLSGLLGGTVAGSKIITVVRAPWVAWCKTPIPVPAVPTPDTYCDEHCNQGPPPEKDLPVKIGSDGKVYVRIPYTGRPDQGNGFYLCCPPKYQQYGPDMRCNKNP